MRYRFSSFPLRCNIDLSLSLSPSARVLYGLLSNRRFSFSLSSSERTRWFALSLPRVGPVCLHPSFRRRSCFHFGVSSFRTRVPSPATSFEQVLFLLLRFVSLASRFFLGRWTGRLFLGNRENKIARRWFPVCVLAAVENVEVAASFRILSSHGSVRLSAGLASSCAHT